MKIYDHPLNASVTIIEIEKQDEQEEFLNEVIGGFEKHGNAYPSSSCGDSTKKVIYLDGRHKNIFKRDETEILCDLTVQLAKIDGIDCGDITERSISMAQAAGNKDLLDRLISMPAEYFSVLKPAKKAS